MQLMGQHETYEPQASVTATVMSQLQISQHIILIWLLSLSLSVSLPLHEVGMRCIQLFVINII